MLLECLARIIPTVMLASMCVKSKSRPVLVSPNSDIPTKLITKSGPELLQNASILSASSFVQRMREYK